ncbi:MAG TPA: oxidoreductase, partial [Chitinophaga sp.]
PLLGGQQTTGAFAMDFLTDGKTGIVVGGDYANDTLRTGNCALTTDGGRNWKPATTAPFGYRSGVTFITTKWLAATGTSGTDLSEDGGQNWYNLDKTGYNTVKKRGDGRSAILAGNHGKIAILTLSGAGKK